MEKKVIAYDALKTFLIFGAAVSGVFIFTRVTSDQTNVSIGFMLAVVLVSRFTHGYGWGILASVAGVVGVNYFFTYPYLELDFTRNGYPITFLGMLSISLIVGAMTTNIKETAIVAKAKEEKTNILYEISKKLMVTRDIDQIGRLAAHYASSVIGCNSEFVKEQPTRGAYLVVGNQECTYGYIELAGREVIGLEEDDNRFLNLILTQVSMSLERQILSDKQRGLEVETEKEKTRANLLRAVSHDLRTPLTGMIGASATLMENRGYLSELEQEQLINNIHDSSNWLLNMVENLLSVTRIKENGVMVNKLLEPVEEVVSEAVTTIKKRFPEAKISVKVPKELLMVPMDATLIEQVLLNLVENSIIYAENQKQVELLVEQANNYALFHIMDRGIGLLEENITNLFDEFSHLRNHSSDAHKGMGIGLSICKTIINAHGGLITADNRPDGGAIFTFTLPLEGSRNYE